jgi:hypothetical protein
MARMLGVTFAGSESCCRRHSPKSVQRNGRARNAEKRVTQKWLDEYENRVEIPCPWNYLEWNERAEDQPFMACLC